MIDAVIAATPRQRDDAFGVRIAVFVDEQGISREEELDDLDETAVHCVGYFDGVPIAAGRAVLDGLAQAGSYAKIGRMAVLREHRGKGAGRAVLAALEREAAERGFPRFRLDAQLHARGFYEAAGYAATGDVFDDVGIPHIAMEKTAPRK